MFESVVERDKELNNLEISDRQLYIETESLFIIREQESAKTP